MNLPLMRHVLRHVSRHVMPHVIVVGASLAVLPAVGCSSDSQIGEGTTRLGFVQQADDAATCASLKKQIRVAQIYAAANDTLAATMSTKIATDEELLGKYKPQVALFEAVIASLQTEVDNGRGNTAWVWVDTAVLFVFDGLSIYKLGSAVRTAGAACAKSGVRAAAAGAAIEMKREIKGAFAKGVIPGGKKVIGMAVSKVGPAGYLSGMSAKRYFESAGDWKMAIPVYGTWQENRIAIAAINSVADALAMEKGALADLKANVAAIEKDINTLTSQRDAYTTKADGYRKQAAALQAQLQALEAKMAQQCGGVLPQSTEVVLAPIATGTNADASDNLDASARVDGSADASSDAEAGVCPTCDCPITMDGTLNIPDGTDVAQLPEVLETQDDNSGIDIYQLDLAIITGHGNT